MIQTLLRYIKRRSLTYGNPVKSCNIAGYTIITNISEGIQKSMYIGGFELEETQWVYDILKPGMVFVDVGASYGYYSFIASSLVGSTGRVYAFEPSESPFAMFTHNIRQNNITNIHPYNIGLGDKEEQLELYDSVGLPENPHNIHAPSFIPAGRHYVASQLLGKKPITTLDLFSKVHGIRYIDLIKIDVEGFELQVLKGMRQLFRGGKVKRVFIEYVDHDPLLSEGSITKEMDTFLTAYGFRIEKTRIYEKGTDEATTSNFLYVSELC